MIMTIFKLDFRMEKHLTRIAGTGSRNSFSMVYRYNLSKDNNNVTGTNTKAISLIDKNYAQKRESQYEIVKG